jgi:hypothetical protein
MRHLFTSTLSFFLAISLAGCSGGEGGTASSPACNTLAQDGSPLTLALASNPPPEAAGGTIDDGTYALTTARLFYVPTNVDITRSIGITLEVKGDVIERVSEIDGKVTRHSFKYTKSGTTLTLTGTCGTTETETHGFTAKTGQLELITPESGTKYTMDLVFTKR